MAEEQRRENANALRLGWLWFVLGLLFVFCVAFDMPLLKSLFRLALES